MRKPIVWLVALVSAGASLAAESPRQAFVKTWVGRTVVVRSSLYSLVYNERGKLGNTRSGKREGVIVATPSNGMYFQFDGRQGRDDVVQSDLQRLIAAVNTAYEPDSLDVRKYRKVEALALNQYDRGLELVVSGVRFDRDEVRVEFRPAVGGGDEDAVTSLRIKWPLPLSKEFAERENVENLIRRFVEMKAAP